MAEQSTHSHNRLSARQNQVGDSQVAIESAGGISCTGVSKQYGAQTVLKNVQLRVERGTIFGLLGQNGSGKTTLMKIMMGLVQPTSGTVLINGQSGIGRHHRSRQVIGYAPEKPCMFSWMRIEEVIRFASHFYPTWDDAFCRELIERFELDPKKKVRALSKGMAAKVSLLLAFAYHPSFLVLDEPTSGLDPIVRRDLLEIINDLVKRERATVLVTSHITSDIETIADQIAILHRGEILLTSNLGRLMGSTRRIRVQIDPEQPLPVDPRGTIWRKKVFGNWDLTVTDFDQGVEKSILSSPGVHRIESIREMNLEAIFYDIVKGNSQSL